MTKALIAYFSRKGENYVNGEIKSLEIGNTEVAAQMIQELTGADMFHIEPVQEYSTDYNVCIEEAKRDKGANIRPEFKNPLADISEYDTVYIGFPNYWGTMPMHVWTFMERYDFSGKTIKPFCTHEGSDIGSSEQDIRNLCPNSKVENALSIHGASVSEAKASIENWV
ncbi:flavodoxin [Kineothrix sp. MB12-C1]|uniref:flavodoxin n=1 Tax=Kineothrix sp. MB12-C1 TaxID=3070215 RepID=UPI0027D31E99|nr:flavodoxin [Kineothrix sp. MB12-C1]WMC93333.1 flavodoxin [Kineothrix sp. MB12-C1]